MDESWREGGGLVVVTCSFFCRWSSRDGVERRRRQKKVSSECSLSLSLSCDACSERRSSCSRRRDAAAVPRQQCNKSFEKDLRESQRSVLSFSISEAERRRREIWPSLFFDRVCRSKNRGLRLATARNSITRRAYSRRRFAWRSPSLL